MLSVQLFLRYCRLQGINVQVQVPARQCSGKKNAPSSNVIKNKQTVVGAKEHASGTRKQSQISTKNVQNITQAKPFKRDTMTNNQVSSSMNIQSQKHNYGRHSEKQFRGSWQSADRWTNRKEPGAINNKAMAKNNNMSAQVYQQQVFKAAKRVNDMFGDKKNSVTSQLMQQVIASQRPSVGRMGESGKVQTNVYNKQENLESVEHSVTSQLMNRGETRPTGSFDKTGTRKEEQKTNVYNRHRQEQFGHDENSVSRQLMQRVESSRTAPVGTGGPRKEELKTNKYINQDEQREDDTWHYKTSHADREDIHSESQLSRARSLPMDPMLPKREVTFASGIITRSIPNQPKLPTWNAELQRYYKYLTTSPPRNGFDEMINLTENGLLWKFPIDNEQGMESENNVHFTKHVFLDEHLEGWCPPGGPIRHFMDLVCIGLSKNPYITVEEKMDHIMWYRDYFADKSKLLLELGALPEEIPKRDISPNDV